MIITQTVEQVNAGLTFTGAAMVCASKKGHIEGRITTAIVFLSPGKQRTVSGVLSQKQCQKLAMNFMFF